MTRVGYDSVPVGGHGSGHGAAVRGVAGAADAHTTESGAEEAPGGAEEADRKLRKTSTRYFYVYLRTYR